MKFSLKKVMISFAVIVISGGSLFAFAKADLMDTLFQPSKNLDQVINIGNNKNAVGNEIFRGSSTFSIEDGFSSKAPLLVRITQTLLRLTIALAVPVLIFVGVKLIRSGMNGGSLKESFQEVSGVLLGLALALSAMGIIYLIQSVAIRSLSGVI